MTKALFDRLPDELISSILVTAFAMRPISTGDPAYTPHDRLEFPALMQCVSCRWRAITLSTPALWTAIPIRDPGGNATLPHLERSGVLELEVYVKLPSLVIPAGLVPDTSPDETVDIMVGHHSGRIRKLDIHAETSADAFAIVLGLPTHLPNLTDFSVRAARCIPGHQNELVLVAPRLRSLLLLNYASFWPGLTLSSNIQTLSIEEEWFPDLEFEVLTETLRGFSQLRELSLRNQLLDDIAGGYPQIEPIVLDYLEVLSLRAFDRSELTTLIHLIRTPRLKRLYIEGPGDVDVEGRSFEFQLPMLESLVVGRAGFCYEIARHLPNVRHLGLIFQPVEELREEVQRQFRLLTAFWETLPHPLPLETLTIDSISPTALLALFDKDGGCTLLPYLRKLSIHDVNLFGMHRISDSVLLQPKEMASRLEEVVELEIYGMENEDDLFEAWDKEELWREKRHLPNAEV